MRITCSTLKDLKGTLLNFRERKTLSYKIKIRSYKQYVNIFVREKGLHVRVKRKKIVNVFIEINRLNHGFKINNGVNESYLCLYHQKQILQNNFTYLRIN